MSVNPFTQTPKGFHSLDDRLDADFATENNRANLGRHGCFLGDEL